MTEKEIYEAVSKAYELGYTAGQGDGYIKALEDTRKAKVAEYGNVQRV